MAKHDDRNGQPAVCSFCGKSQEEVKKLIAGPTVYICDECIDLCNDIIAEETDGEEAFSQTSAVPKPAEIKRVLDEYVIGQERAKKILSVAVHNHYKRIDSQMVSRRRRAAEVQHPAARPDRLGQDAAGADAGAVPASAVHHRRRHHPHRGRLRRRGRREHHPVSCCRTPTTTSSEPSAASSTSTRSTRSRARATTRPSPATSRARACSRRCSRSSRARSATSRPRAAASTRSRSSCRSTPPTSCSSAAARSSGLEEIIERRIGRQDDGLSAPSIAAQEQVDVGELLIEVQPEDLLKFGLIPEFVGRLPVIATLRRARRGGAGAHPDRAEERLVKQYQKLFEMEGVKLKFTEGALARHRARGAQAQVRRARPARHPREHHARHHVRHPVAAQHQGGGDHRGGGESEGTADAGLPERPPRPPEASWTRTTRCSFVTTRKTIATTRQQRSFPLLPLRDLIVFPHMVVPLFVGREKSINALEEAEARQGASCSRPRRTPRPTSPAAEDIYRGRHARRRHAAPAAARRHRQGAGRGQEARAHRALRRRQRQFFQVEVEEIDRGCERTIEVEALMRSVNSTFENYVKLNKRIPPEMLMSVAAIDDPARLADTHRRRTSAQARRQAGDAGDRPSPPSGWRSFYG